MALQFTPEQTVDALQRAGDGPAVGLIEDGCAHILFHYAEEGHCYVFKIDADEAWMGKLVKLSEKVKWAKDGESFIRAAFALWPEDDCVQQLVMWAASGRPQ